MWVVPDRSPSNQLVEVVEEIAGIKCPRNYLLDAAHGVRGGDNDNIIIEQICRSSLNEIGPVPRGNGWAPEHGLTDCRTLLYSGILGLKHNRALLVELARQILDAGEPVRLVVVSGTCRASVGRETASLGVSLMLLPFKPYGRLPGVLGTSDVLVVLLERDAGSFSVSSKTLSNLCANWSVLALMPLGNAAPE